MGRMSKAEIMAELAHLSAEDLADVRAWLDQLALEKAVSKADRPAAMTARIRSPRLAKPAQAADFIKQVSELPANAAL
jgi:hypothetical protein